MSSRPSPGCTSASGASPGAGSSSGCHAWPVASASSRYSSSTRKIDGSASSSWYASSGRGEPPRERQQDQAEPRAREHHHHVLGRVAGERRDAVAARQAGRRERGAEALRPVGELAVGDEAIVVVDRDAARRVPGAVGDDPVDHGCRNSIISSATASESSQTSRWPRSGTISTRAFGISSPSSSALRGSTTTSAPPCTTSVGLSIEPTRSSSIERRARRRLRDPRLASTARARAGRRRSPRRGPAARGRRARRASSRRTCRSAASRSMVGYVAKTACVASGIGCAFGPPTAVEQRTSFSTRSGEVSVSSCAM